MTALPQHHEPPFLDVEFVWISAPLVPFELGRWPVQEAAYKCQAERHQLRHGTTDIGAYPDAAFLEFFREKGSSRILRFWTACQECHDMMTVGMEGN